MTEPTTNTTTPRAEGAIRYHYEDGRIVGCWIGGELWTPGRLAALQGAAAEALAALSTRAGRDPLDEGADRDTLRTAIAEARVLLRRVA